MATLHEARDVCAANGTPITTATMALAEAADSVSIGGPARQSLALIEARDTTAIQGTVSFLTTAQIRPTEWADNVSIIVAPPIWTLPAILPFTQGTAASINIGQYATDPQGDPLTITLETGTLPAGITFATPTLSYDGRNMGASTGSPADTTGVSFGADDSVITVPRMPPAASLTNSQGTWTISGGSIRLNGVAQNYGVADKAILASDSVAWHETGGAGWFGSYVNHPIQDDYNWPFYTRLLSTDPDHDDYFNGVYAALNTPTALNYDMGSEYEAADPTMIGPSNTPTLWDLNFTSEAAIIARKGSPLVANYPGNPQFLLDSAHNNMPYFRFSSNPLASAGGPAGGGVDGSTIIAWFLPFGQDMTTCFVRYCLWIEDDVAAGMNELGMKLPGPSNETGGSNPETELVSYRSWHYVPIGGSFQLRNYRYDRESELSGNPFGVNDNFHKQMRTGRWYVIECQVTLNTVGLANGIKRYWLNGNMIAERTNVTFRAQSATRMRAFHFNFYHGGGYNPISLIHYRVAHAAASASYIGVPTELL